MGVGQTTVQYGTYVAPTWSQGCLSMNSNEKISSSFNPNDPPAYAPPNFDGPNPYHNRPIDGPMGSPYLSGPIMNQPYMNKPPPPQMINQAQMAPMQMASPQIAAHQFAFTPQMYPYNTNSFFPTADVTQCKESCIAHCHTCGFIGLTHIEKKFSNCQLVIGILMICTISLSIPGILILIYASDYEHFCTRCKKSIGKKTTC